MIRGSVQFRSITATGDHDGFFVLDIDILHDHPGQRGVVDESLGDAILDTGVCIDVDSRLLGKTLFALVFSHSFLYGMLSILCLSSDKIFGKS